MTKVTMAKVEQTINENRALVLTAVTAYLQSADRTAEAKEKSQKVTDEARSVIEGAKRDFDKVAENQLAALDKALEGYPEPMTEAAWDTHFAKQVREQVESARRSNGTPQYTSSNSRNQAVHMLKVTTIGLTNARTNDEFKPSPKSSRNLKKYLGEVTKKLQAAGLLTPQIGGGKAERELPEGKYYWLIGCRTEQGWQGPNSLICATRRLSVLQTMAGKRASEFVSFIYCVSGAEPLPTKEEPEKDTLFTNATVKSNTISSKDS